MSSPTKCSSAVAFLQISWAAIILVLLSSQAAAQSTYPTDGSTAMGLKPGAPAGSYSLSGFDNVNLFNGNLNFRLPLLGIGGRGGASHSIMLPIEKKWQVESYTIQGDDWSETHYYPDGDWWEVTDAGYGPGVMHVRYGSHLTRNCSSDGIKRAWWTLTRLTFSASDGTEFELRDVVGGGAKSAVPICATSGFNRGRVFVTADGTSATFISDANIVDLHLSDGSGGETNQYVSGYLTLSDGTRYRIDGGYVTWIRDRNGNKISFSYTNGKVTTITDSLNRQITIAYNVQDGSPYGLCDKITFKGNGGATRIIRISKTSMANVLRSGYALQSLASLFPNLEGSSSGTFNPTVISDVWLPNDQRYQFRYNSHAELARVVLPTGGAVEYDHAPGWASSTDVGGTINVGAVWAIYRRVLERREYADGTNLTNKMTYGRYVLDPGLTSGTVLVDQRNAGGTLLGRQKHYFYGLDPGETITSQTPVKYPAWDEGKEYQTESFDFNGTTVLRRVNHVWQGNGTMGGLTVKARIVETTSTIEPSGANLVSKQTFTHDQYNNQTNTYEYDFGVGSAGALVRRTQTTYITSNHGYDYACDPASTCNASANIANVIHLRSLPAQISTKDAGGTERARTTYEYDNYTTDANHAALLNRVSISGLDAEFTTNYSTRGNATATTSYLLSGGVVTGSISSFAQYDIAGNIIKTIDGRGFATLLDFTDRFGSPDGDARLNSAPLELSTPGQASYAFATLATNALGHTAYTQIDYNLGRAIDMEDANGVVSSGYFNDVLDRPTQLIIAVNHASVKTQTTFSYDDANRIVTSTSDLNSYNDNLIKTQSLYDAMGRTFESRQYEGGTNYIATKRNYDALGRANQISNPYRPWQGETPVWMTTTFDALGRTLTATTSDNSVVTTSYSGNTVTATDQIGKQRKSVSDALGRLKEIYEDPGPTGLNYLTSYSHDVLDNLITVAQGSQTRTFVYDSLKRLTSATNPESGAGTYQYDNNGNLTLKTDARGVSISYVYDALNRSTTIDYSNTTTINPDITRVYDTAINGKGLLHESYAGGTETSGTNVEHTRIVSYDVLARALDQRQRFKSSGVWSAQYRTQQAYNLAGNVTSQIYPSGRSVNYSFDNAGRLISFTGNLGDGIARNYSTGIVYSSQGGMAKEQFGTDTPLYNKSFYNSRGQLSEIRVSTSYTDPTDTTWNRGAIINHYSNQCWGVCNGTDNNGNLKKQEVYIPSNDQLPTTSWTNWWQAYDYDNLNRLQRVKEYNSGGSQLWQQEYVYDRWGNRTIHQTNTWGTGINKKDFTANTTNNRLGAPGGQSGTMTFDNAGNLTNDTYTGGGSREYDAENRMTKAWGGNSQWQEYFYDANGQRVRRKVDGIETRQIYGMSGELLAEYPANTGVPHPQREYGYRNGQLLVTAEPTRANVALVSNGATASASTYLGQPYNYYPSYANDGARTSINGGIWLDGTINAFPDWIQIDFAGSKTISEIDVITQQTDHQNPVEPTLTQTFTANGITAFDVQYWTGSGWTTVPGGSVTGNNKVWRQFTFAPITTNKIKVVINAGYDNSYSRVVEVEAWEAAPTNFALPTNGGTASASSYLGSPYNLYPSYVNDGARTSISGGLWLDNTLANFPDWIQVDFNGNKTITEIDVITQQTDYQNPVEPTLSQTFTANGITAFEVQYWNGTAWTTVPGGNVSGNNKVWRQFTFAPITTSKIRVVVNAGYDNAYSRVVEVEAWNASSVPSNVNVNWLVSDQLGTPRMIFNKTGSLATTKRQDYLPFGEELYSNQGVRTSALGYKGNSIRQRFTSYERDGETGLDYAQARYCSSSQGRFTSPDPLMGSAKTTDPQTWNRYAYVGNSPMVFSDPSGLSRGPAGMYSSIRSLDGPPASRGNNTILQEAQAEYEGKLADTLAAIKEADSINDALKKGKMTEAQAREKAEKNPMLKVETQKPVPSPAPTPTPAPPAGQPLTPCVKSRLGPYFPGLDLNQVQVREGIPGYVPGNPDAYTQGNTIYFKPGQYDPNSAEGLSLIGHELTHVQQWATVKNFPDLYLLEYARLRAQGLDHDTAYRSISFEQQADKKGRIIYKDLNNLSRQFGGRDPCPK